jgi:hypothetical protein
MLSSVINSKFAPILIALTVGSYDSEFKSAWETRFAINSLLQPVMKRNAIGKMQERDHHFESNKIQTILMANLR